MIMLKFMDYNLMESTHDIIMWTKYIYLDFNVICRSKAYHLYFASHKTIENVFKAINLAT